MAIVYEHLRNDTNELFYVGIGKFEKRAFSKQGRNNPHWHNIAKKVGYTVNIIHSDIDWEEAKNIEKSLIKKYGRLNLGTGILVNMTDGGDGVVGLKYPEEARQKISEAMKGKPKSEEHKNKLSEGAKGRLNTEVAKARMRISAKNRSKDAEKNINNGRKNRKLTKGYSWHKGHKKWVANIRTNKKLIHLGYFILEEEARNAYLNAKLIYHIME
jgi:hypothetical protein